MRLCHPPISARVSCASGHLQLDIIRDTEVNITSAMTDQSDGLATEQKNHKRSGDLLAKVQKKLAAQQGEAMICAALSTLALRNSISMAPRRRAVRLSLHRALCVLLCA